MPRVVQTNERPEVPIRKRTLRLRPAYLILCVLMALFAFKFIQKTQEIQSLQKQRVALQSENQQTAADNERLQHAMLYYQSDQYIGAQARAVFGYTLPGDVAIQSQPVHPRIVRVRQAPLPPAAPRQPTWRQWWRVFFG